MPPMKVKNLRTPFQWVCSVSSLTRPLYADFEYAWNTQSVEFNKLYADGEGATKETLTHLLKAVEDLSERKEPDHKTALAKLQEWPTILPALSDYCESLNSAQSQITKWQKKGYAAQVKDADTKLKEIRKTKKLTLTEFTAAKVKVEEHLAEASRFVTYAMYTEKIEDLQSEYERLEPQLPGLKALYEPLVGKVNESSTKEAVETQIEEVAKVETRFSEASTYLELLLKVRAELKEILTLLPPTGKSSLLAVESNKELLFKVETIGSDVESSNDYPAATEKLQKLKDDLPNIRETRIADTRKEAVGKMKDSRQEELFEKLNGATDDQGMDLVVALYMKFPGDNFENLLAGFDVQTDDEDKSVASKHIITLCKSIGVNGLAKVCDAFSGDGTVSKDGAQAVGDLLNRGVTDTQIAQLLKKYTDKNGETKLKPIIKEGFQSNSELFASVLTVGLAGKSKGKNDLRVENLKKLTDSFNDNTKLGQLLDGLAGQHNVTTPLPDKKAAGKRMNDLINKRFGGDPTKLKKPFFDVLSEAPGRKEKWRDERDKLAAKRQELIDYNNLSNEEKEKKETVPRGLNLNEQQRLNYLNENVFGTYPYTPMDLKNLIRNASSFQVSSPDGFTPKDLKGCDSAKMDHFLRHTREHQNFKGDHLAPGGTLDSIQIKPTTFWPEKVTDKEVAQYVTSALANTTVPDATDFEDGETRKTEFVNCGGCRCKIGFKLYRGKVIVDQFYPISGGDSETIEFFDMQSIKRAIEVL